MANLFIHGNGEELPRASTEANPFRWMRWDPFRETAKVSPGDEQPARFAPDFEVKETKEGFVFKVDVPGIKETDIEITMTGNQLTISGKRETETEEKTDIYYASERSYGSFTRAFTMPARTDSGDHIHADLKEGVLTLLLPKKPEVQPRRIEVKVADKPKSS
jgi:HSP20 family protein